jgi:2-dehydropantoate 2-reductase
MPKDSHKPQSIAIIGAGRIGSAFTYQLAKAGHDLTLIARPGSQRLAQLERDGGIMLRTGERAEATISDRLDEQQPYDVVIVTVLAHQVDSVLPALQRSMARYSTSSKLCMRCCGYST